MGRRFRELRTIIRKAVVERDVLGLSNIQTQQELPGYKAFDFTRSSDKIEAFMKWLEKMEEVGILELIKFPSLAGSPGDPWTNIYIKRAYEKGIERGTEELRRAGFIVPSIEAVGGIAVVFNQPFHADRVALLFTRVFRNLKGITDAMDNQISTVLAQAMVEGVNPNTAAKWLTRTISGPMGDLSIKDSLGRFIPAERRAKILARTEIIRAHHLATIQTYRDWAVEEVIVKAEWSTARDDRVCSICAPLDGKVFELDEIEGMIPRHPQCRCIALPLKVN